MSNRITRRDFMRIGTQGLAAVGLGTTALPLIFRDRAALAQTMLEDLLVAPVSLTMEEVMWEMVDGTDVYAWCFRDDVTPADPVRGNNGFHIPGVTLFAVEGDTLQIRVRNSLPGTLQHGFAIPGIVETGPIAPGATVTLKFTAPAAGTYLYLDPFNAPMNRAMGLHGVLVVLPRAGNTPYGSPTPNVQKLFNDLGTTGWTPGLGSDHFPGHPWDPSRTWLWVFETVDSVKHAQVEANPSMAAADFLHEYLPDYFLISGKGGAFSSHDHEIGPYGNIGQPALIRAVNAGLNNASPHIHGNHVYLLAENNAVPAVNLPGQSLPSLPDLLPANGQVHENVVLLDTWTMRPGDRKDLLLPFVLPPDVPVDREIDFLQAGLTAGERQGRLGDGIRNDPLGQFSQVFPPHTTPYPSLEEPYPWVYPMHDHDEIAQTAAHGNYPHGAVLHWQVEGPIDCVVTRDTLGANRRQELDVVPGNDGVVFVDEATLHPKHNRLVLRGTYSGAAGRELDIHAGPDFSGPRLGRAVCRADGTWSLRTQALRVTSTRMVSVRALGLDGRRITHQAAVGTRTAVRVRVR